VQEFRHAWEGYRTYAWGHDALRPLSRSAHDWYGVSLCMTPLDAFRRPSDGGWNPAGPPARLAP
jgi:hypothetical protein